jgi:hypothetical protein
VAQFGDGFPPYSCRHGRALHDTARPLASHLPVRVTGLSMSMPETENLWFPVSMT